MSELACLARARHRALFIGRSSRAARLGTSFNDGYKARRAEIAPLESVLLAGAAGEASNLADIGGREL